MSPFFHIVERTLHSHHCFSHVDCLVLPYIIPALLITEQRLENGIRTNCVFESTQ